MFSLDSICPPTLLLLKGYHKFVPRIEIRCWVLQIAILENDHNISCVSSEHKPLYIPIGLYFIKRHVWRVKMFHKTVNKAWNLFNLSEQSLENSAENPISQFSINRKLLLIDWMLFLIDWDSRIIFLPFSIDQAKALTDRKCWISNFHFMKQYSPNSNFIFTTYACIYLYIQKLPLIWWWGRAHDPENKGIFLMRRRWS